MHHAHHTAQSMLRSCTWGIAGDLCDHGRGVDTEGDLGATMEAAMEAAPWLATDWVVLRFAAKSFAPQQVRRMAGVVATIVSGAAVCWKWPLGCDTASPASSDGPAGCWVAPRTRQKPPCRSDLQKGLCGATVRACQSLSVRTYNTQGTSPPSTSSVASARRP